MNSLEIVKCIQQDVKARRIFRGIFPHDWLLPTLEKLRFEQKPYVIVCNTHDSSKRGEHWSSIYVNKPAGIVEYFCSLGLPPPHPNIHNFLFQCSPSSKVIFNHRSIQHVSSIACGLYVLYYVMMKARGVSLRKLLSPFSSVYQWQNDRKVRNRVIHLLRKAGVYEPRQVKN